MPPFLGPALAATVALLSAVPASSQMPPTAVDTIRSGDVDGALIVPYQNVWGFTAEGPGKPRRVQGLWTDVVGRTVIRFCAGCRE